MAITVLCPVCGGVVTPLPSGAASQIESRCLTCQWTGKVLLFHPVAPRVERAQMALPDDAVCAHHPNKRATAVCAGTGDFICALCAVDVGGATYSAQYLSQHANEPIAKSFNRYLSRPDSQIILMIGLTFLFSCAAVVTWPWAIICYIRLLRQRKEEPLLHKLVGPVRLTVLGILVFGLPAVGLGCLGLALVGSLIS